MNVKQFLFALAVGVALTVPSAPLATAQEVGATPAVTGPADQLGSHYDVYWLVNHQWVLYGSYPYLWQAQTVVFNLQSQGYVAYWVFHR